MRGERSLYWQGAGLRVEWRPAAINDVRAIFDYLIELNPQAALAVSDALVNAGDSLSALPRRGRPGLIAGTRELVVLRPYIMVYEVDGETDCVRILRIWHRSRDRDNRR